MVSPSGWRTEWASGSKLTDAKSTQNGRPIWLLWELRIISWKRCSTQQTEEEDITGQALCPRILSSQIYIEQKYVHSIKPNQTVKKNNKKKKQPPTNKQTTVTSYHCLWNILTALTHPHTHTHTHMRARTHLKLTWHHCPTTVWTSL